ncbi:MAG: tetratricopeptide repeat protein [Rhodoplanes sp.]|uniref:tetratricopeptide repeat protein n=1 Tax=Rhodoplanes sp. TaxID=1968906 RepID=UPI0017CB47C8|nr:tetratricopeptide repeat protein [Rhodoplanes sp.]NVO12555.1 tetratricopeptide repeat protein [Rhodoplanes sp.]
MVPTRLVVSALALTAAVLLPVAPASAQTARDREVCIGRDAEAAIAACTRLLEGRGKLSAAERARLLGHRAIARSEKGQRQLAIDDYTKAIEADAAAGWAYRGRGLLLQKNGDHDGAIVDLSRSIELDPKQAGAYSGRGVSYDKKGDRARAIEDFTRAIELDPTYHFALYSRALAFRRGGEPDRAIADFDRAIAINPKDADYFTLRGDAWATKGDLDRALRDHDEAIRLDAKNIQAHIYRVLALVKRGDLDRALIDLDEVIRLSPRHTNGLNLRGYVRRQRGDLDGALADLDEAIRLDPKMSVAYSNRGEARRLKGDLDRAIADQGEALRIDPNLSPALTSRGLAFEARGDTARARDDFKAALAAPVRTWLSGSAWSETARAHLAAIDAASPSPPTTASPPTASPPAASVAPSTEPPRAPVTVATPGNRVALVIGNGTYKYATTLPNPPNDAGDLTRSLRTIGFDVVEGINLGKQDMELKIREFGRKLDRADLALFFYAGHGLQVADKNYLVPIDAKLERQGDLAFDTVTVDDVLSQMESERRVNLVFLDACRDNPLARSFASTLGTRSTSVGSGLAPIQSAVGTMIVYATQPKNVALDGDGRNSPFTAALLKHIGTPGLEISAVMKRVRADVYQATRQKQLPWDHSSLIGDVVLSR